MVSVRVRRRLIKESSKSTSKTVARRAEKERRRQLEEGFNAIGNTRTDRIQTIRYLADEFLKEYQVRRPKSHRIAKASLGHVTRLLGDLLAIDVSPETIVQYQTARLREKAAARTINEEVHYFLRLLPVAQTGAIRAQLKQQKKLTLKVRKIVGKAYSTEEKTRLIESAAGAKRSKGILFTTMLAQHAGMRDKEIRTLQWKNLDLVKRIVTVGDSKTDAGTGRTIPMNAELYAVAIGYAKWYTGKFGTSQPNWYVFPAGHVAKDPTRPQTSFARAWRAARQRADVEGRFHDNRHTFVTDLAESGTGDEVIRDLAGHVSKEMLKHYSHIRMQAKRRAVEALTSTAQALPASEKDQTRQNSEVIVQDSVQVTRVN